MWQIYSSETFPKLKATKIWEEGGIAKVGSKLLTHDTMLHGLTMHKHIAANIYHSKAIVLRGQNADHNKMQLVEKLETAPLR